MKIAVLTLPLHTNYGGILQAYALQTVLQRMGHEVEVLQKIPTPTHSSFVMPLVYGKRFFRKIFIDKDTVVFSEKLRNKERPIIEKNTSKFLDKYINLRYIKSLKDISRDDYDAFVVGSDQVWRKPYFCDMWQTSIADAFLNFTKGWSVKRIAYAASFGKSNIDEYSPNDKAQCSTAIKLFDVISVREDSGVKICKDLAETQLEVRHLLDPTMLLSQSDYIKLLMSDRDKLSPGKLLYYILDESDNKRNFIEQIAKEKKLKPFKVNVSVHNDQLSVENRVQPPLEDWLRGFRDAEFVITDSFHACVFSIIFQKPFVVIGNPGRGIGRLTSLLSQFNLESRLIFEGQSSIEDEKINWDSITIQKEKMRQQSLQFLADNLSLSKNESKSQHCNTGL